MQNTKNSDSLITQFNITPFETPRNGAVAIASATFYDMFKVNGITIRESSNGNLYVKMPQKRTLQGTYIDVTHPLNAETRKKINETLLSAYSSGVLQQEFAIDTKPEVTAQYSVKNKPEELGNTLGRLDIVVKDMVIHNCKIINSKDDKPMMIFPVYRNKNGDYYLIIKATNTSVFQEMNNAALSEFNTEYSYKKLDDKDLAVLKNSDIKFISHRTPEGDNIVKFNASDLQKINNALSPVMAQTQK